MKEKNKEYQKSYTRIKIETTVVAATITTTTTNKKKKTNKGKKSISKAH